MLGRHQLGAPGGDEGADRVVKVVTATMTPKTLRQPPVVSHLHREFTRALGGKPGRYEWRFIVEGDFWFYDNGRPVYAERDVVELYAFREELGR